MTTFGDRLRDLRTEKKLNQEDLATKFKISKSAVGMYERNQREPSLELLQSFAEYFEVTVDYLVGRTNTRNSNTNKKDENIFYFDLDGLDEEGIEEIQKAIDYQRWRAELKKQQKK